MLETEKNELRIWLVFYLCKGLGVQTLLKLKQHIELDQLLLLSEMQLQQLGLKPDIINQILHPDYSYINKLENYLIEQKIFAICYDHPAYPPLLKEIVSAPLILFCRGDISLLQAPQLAIVGSRSATANGCHIASEFAYQLNEQGVTVTSGLAGGIDAAAHKGSLAASGKTIAVLGTGVDVIYPKRNKLLAMQIIERGLLVSEFLPGTKAHAANFPRRNRIISGLSYGTVVVEAELKSGSLITARYALEQNREVFAVPGSVLNELSHGCHFLIKQGAKLTENVDDIFEELGLFVKNGLYSKDEVLNCDDEEPLLAELGYDVMTVDELSNKTNIPIEQLLTRLLDLELSNHVERVLGGYVKLRRY
ncbi:DNA-processing protein DprA [Pseudoalteromonas tunicata]|jgi:DNA processing protein|uniref:Uncharacterized protein n=1 Tax=Pseudoalteromonas tunicata D2 TaxID=87626 RepID=A4CDG6_9GAMM|nr:DNA-processing protein DprA [Pseudoalteromonas tunicata]ATC92876.1 DNA processing protein [Pseudoalteromonas tunicata]AXT31979.1 DNA-protecting protein DprA [Pseudoalteromonas tunicata]EAR27008.1 hypothetical protein PTD2_05040 [Pseudoalteromonas tunicata D2]